MKSFFRKFIQKLMTWSRWWFWHENMKKTWNFKKKTFDLLRAFLRKTARNRTKPHETTTKPSRNHYETITKPRENGTNPCKKATKPIASGLRVYNIYYRKPDGTGFVRFYWLTAWFRGWFRRFTKPPRNRYETVHETTTKPSVAFNTGYTSLLKFYWGWGFSNDMIFTWNENPRFVCKFCRVFFSRRGRVRGSPFFG